MRGGQTTAEARGRKEVWRIFTRLKKIKARKGVDEGGMKKKLD